MLTYLVAWALLIVLGSGRGRAAGVLLRIYIWHDRAFFEIVGTHLPPSYIVVFILFNVNGKWE